MVKAKTLLVAFLALAVASCVGCGKDNGYKAVTGKVTMNGEPVAGATVTFFNQSSDGEGGGGLTGADGSFTATSTGASEGGKGLQPGEYKVTVVKFKDEKDPDQEAFDKGEITYDELQERKAKQGTYGKSMQYELLTPKKYQLVTTTTLTITVTEDPKQNVFELKLDE